MDHRHTNLTRTAQGPILHQFVLNNGAICVIADMPDATLTCLDLWCRAGSFFERTGEEGLAHFLEHMVFKGSKLLSAGEFDRKIEALGGSSNAATGFDDVHFYVLVPTNSMNSALELLLNLVLEPTLCPESFSMEREVVIEEIAQYNDQPEEKIFQTLLENCWGKHPYGRPILGSKESLKNSNPLLMRDFHNRLYQGRNCCLSIAGSTPLDMEAIINKSLLANLKNTNDVSLSLKDEHKLIFNKGREEISVHRLEASRILMAWPIPGANNQSKIMGADIATSLLAEGRSSQLVKKLREDLQIVESIEMDISVMEKGSLVVLEACCMQDQLKRVEGEIHKILKETLCSLPRVEEVNRAKQLVKNNLIFGLESSIQVAGMAANYSLWKRHQPLLETLKYIDEWSVENLQNEIFNLLQPENSFSLIATPKT